MNATVASAAAPAETVTVALGRRSYDIVIAADALASLGERVAALAPGARVAVVADETVEQAHGTALRAALKPHVEVATTVAVPPGEASKSFAELERLVGRLLEARLERGDLVVAFGGGVVGDLAGFAAAILRRGVRYVQVPTTLLAQVDSAVGGKTGINTAHGKNLVGAFHHPGLVLADTRLLDTLPAREFRAGYAETVKYGLIGDAAFFAWLEGAWRELFAGGPARVRAIATSCRAKALIVAEDEREENGRALLNLGHTFAHALEAAVGYSGRLVHGEAVALGLVLAFAFSARLGYCDADVEARIARHLDAAGLPTRPAQIPGGAPPAERLMELVLQDKKMRRGTLTLVLATGIGEAFLSREVATEELGAFLADRFDSA